MNRFSKLDATVFKGPNLPTAALTPPQKVWTIWELVKLKMLDFNDDTITGISGPSWYEPLQQSVIIYKTACSYLKNIISLELQSYVWRWQKSKSRLSFTTDGAWWTVETEKKY